MTERDPAQSITESPNLPQDSNQKDWELITNEIRRFSEEATLDELKTAEAREMFDFLRNQSLAFNQAIQFLTESLENRHHDTARKIAVNLPAILHSFTAKFPKPQTTPPRCQLIFDSFEALTLDSLRKIFQRSDKIYKLMYVETDLGEITSPDLQAGENSNTSDTLEDAPKPTPEQRPKPTDQLKIGDPQKLETIAAELVIIVTTALQTMRDNFCFCIEKAAHRLAPNHQPPQTEITPFTYASDVVPNLYTPKDTEKTVLNITNSLNNPDPKIAAKAEDQLQAMSQATKAEQTPWQQINPEELRQKFATRFAKN